MNECFHVLLPQKNIHSKLWVCIFLFIPNNPSWTGSYQKRKNSARYKRKILKFLVPWAFWRASRRWIRNPHVYSNLLVSQGGTEMLLNISLQNGVKMLKFPVSNESYYVDLRKIQGIRFWGSDPTRSHNHMAQLNLQENYFAKELTH